MIPLLDIADDVAVAEGYRWRDLIARARGRRLDAVRNRAMWVCREVRPDASLTQIGRVFCRHHTSVLLGVRRFEEKVVRAASVAIGESGHAT